MRTIQEIKQGITAEWMSDEHVQQTYGFDADKSFYEVFSPVSVESLLFYVVAACIFVVEAMVEALRSDVSEKLSTLKPHRPRWYRDKVLAFMPGVSLITDSDEYDLSGMTEAEIEQQRPVKHAAVTEADGDGLIVIRVAGGTPDAPQPLDSDLVPQLEAYVREIKDAGVRFRIINRQPDVFNATVHIYYDATFTYATVRQACLEAARRYIMGLPFNGEYTNMALSNALQSVEGVKVVEMKGASRLAAGSVEPTPIDARAFPNAGYFTPGNINIVMKPYNASYQQS